MNRKNDIRARRTRKAICNGFAELMEKKSFDKISIRDIAEKAMINRSTFYLHFDDKYDLTRYMAEEMLKEIEGSFQRISSEDMGRYLKEGRPYPHAIKLLEVIEDKNRIMKCILESKDGFMLYGKIIESAFQRHVMLEKVFDRGDSMAAYRQEAFTASICVVIKKWIDEGMTVHKEQMAYFLTEMARKELI